MSGNKIKIYSISIVLIIITLALLFINSPIIKLVYSIIIAIIAIITKKILVKKSNKNTNTKQVTFLMVVFAVAYIVISYVMGIYFGFSYAISKFSLQSLLLKIIPIIIIIISMEHIRNILIGQPVKHINTIVLITMLCIDMVIYSGMFLITTLDGFLANFGYVFFSSITFNLLYNYTVKEISYEPIVVFKIITTIYPYIIPIVPNTYQFLRTFLRIIYPLFIYQFVKKFYSRKFTKNFSDIGYDKVNTVSIVAFIITAMLVIGLVSNKFQYGVYVIGSESMTGTLNKGDCLIYEKYEDDYINVGDILVYNCGDHQNIHRVIEIKQYMRRNSVCY